MAGIERILLFPASLAGPALRARLGARARRTAVERYSWEAIAEAAYHSYMTLKKVTPKSVTHAGTVDLVSTDGAARGDGATPAGRAI